MMAADLRSFCGVRGAIGRRTRKIAVQADDPARVDVASFGEKLRQAREARNITLQDLAASTKIATRTLQAIEDGRFDLLPGGIFNKGFVRSYAREVGLDEDETVAEYLEASKSAPLETDLDVLASQVEGARRIRQASGPNAATVVGVVAILVALVLGGLWLEQHRKDVREQAEEEHKRAEISAANQAAQTPSIPQQAVAAASSVPVSAAPGETAPSAASPGALNTAGTGQSGTASTATTQPAAKTSVASGSRAATGAGIEISVSAKARAWISVLRDDRPAETLTLDPSKPELSSRTYTAKDRVTLIVGNPAGVEVTCNGKPTGSLGKPGQRSTVTFTAEGIDVQQ
jgi:cytoskeletal protein RodZ